jgi:hypothetical protein
VYSALMFCTDAQAPVFKLHIVQQEFLLVHNR